LRARIAELIPTEAPPHPPVDITEALHANWLELWYQPKIEARSLMLSGAEALVRMRHPSWGTVPPAYFIPDEDDPHFGALSDFVTSRAITDWHYFVSAHGPVEIAINLPARFFENPNAIETLARQLPDHPAFEVSLSESTAMNSFATFDFRRRSRDSFSSTISAFQSTISAQNGPCSWSSMNSPLSRSRLTGLS
jgi:EAL domain-containing protein (putative c-di-GMP-specific phosphodiesterase class I)